MIERRCQEPPPDVTLALPQYAPVLVMTIRITLLSLSVSLDSTYFGSFCWDLA